jgi:hypothetical protein
MYIKAPTSIRISTVGMRKKRGVLRSIGERQQLELRRQMLLVVREGFGAKRWNYIPNN